MNNKKNYFFFKDEYHYFIKTILTIKYIYIFLFFLALISHLTILTFLHSKLEIIIKSKEFIELFFNILMGLLLVFLFYPFKKFPKHFFNHETKVLLFLFGLVNIIVFVKDIFFKKFNT